MKILENKKLNDKKWLLSLIILFILLLSSSCTYFNENTTNISNQEENKTSITTSTQDNKTTKQEEISSTTNIVHENLIIHYINVGQGDSIFIELPNKMVMLIDAGESSASKIVANYIKNLGYNKIDYIVGTHPHTDHIGGLAYIINNFEIGKIYMTKVISTSKTYENLLNTISSKGLKVTKAFSGQTIYNDENLLINIIAPNQEYNSINNNSVVIKISYQNRKFLFMGDAEVISENDITYDVSADIIKVGHHGSDSSSSESFVKKVNASYAIIMVGENNQYDHPYQSIIERWNNSGAIVYRTDINGNIVAISDGNSLIVNKER